MKIHDPGGTILPLALSKNLELIYIQNLNT